MDEDFYTRYRAENRRLGLLFGLVVGLGFSAALFLPDAWKMYQANVEGAWVSLGAGLLLCLPLALLAGWLVGAVENGLFRLLVWVLTAAAMSWIAGHIPYEVQSWWVSWSQPGFRTLTAYPYGISAQARSVISMVISALIALLVGGFQSQAVDDLRSGVGLRRASLLIVCTVFFVGAGTVGNITMFQPLREPLIAVDDLFRIAERYQGQELSASQMRTLRLTTLKPLQDLLDQPRRLYLGSYDPQSLESARVNLTLGEEWVSCLVLAGQPLYCQKSSEMYGSAFACLWKNGLPERGNCDLRMTPEAQNSLSGAPALRGVRVVSQIGQYSLVEVLTTGEHQVFLCRISETAPRTLENCQASTAASSQAPLWLAPTQAPQSSPVQPREDASELDGLADQPIYNLEVLLDPDHQRFSGQLSLVYTNTQAGVLDELLFRLLPNGKLCYGNGELQAGETVRVNGSEVSSSSPAGDASQLQVPLPGGLSPGQSVQLSMVFTGTVPLDFGGAESPYAYGIYNLSENVLTMASWYPILAVYENGSWRTDPVSVLGDSVYSEIAYYHVEITAPTAWRVVATGAQRSQASAGEGWTRYTYESGPMRDFFITASPDFQLISRTAGDAPGVRVNVYYSPGSEEGAAQVLDVGQQALEIFTAYFGAYPYSELDIVQVPMRNASGVEYPGVILIGSERYSTPHDPVFILTVAHEVAHQWWYNVVGSDVFQEPWLDEGLTTYSSGIYYEFSVGRPAFNEVHSYWQTSVDRLLKEGRDVPISWSLREFEQSAPDAYAPVAYSKAALFFDDLRKETGDDAFFAALRTYYQQQQFGIAHADDLRAAFIQVAGSGVNDVFDRWLVETP